MTIFQETTFHPLITKVLENRLFDSQIHGPDHWARVLENGLRLAPDTGADVEVVALFAIFHDSQRENDGPDMAHGPRAVKFLRTIDLGVTDHQRSLLIKACGGHTVGVHTGDPTIATCWDADRLDISRIGVTINPVFLSTKAACKPSTLAWAQERGERGHCPDFCIEFL